MRLETAEKKKKTLKNKSIIEDILKEEGISRNLSKVEQNKLILNAMAKDKNEESDETENVEQKEKKQSIREFKCECGILVKLEGDIAKDNSINKCSVCRSK